MILVDVQTVSIVIAAVSVVIAVINSILTNRRAESRRQMELKTRQVKFFFDLWNRFCRKDILTMYLEVFQLWKWEDFNDFYEKYGPEKNLDEFMKWVIVTTHIETMGLIAYEKMVDIRFVANLLGSTIQDFWEKAEPILIEWRKRYNTPKIMPMTEHLYEQIKTMRPRES